MKKLIYSLAIVLAGLVSCTTFDDPTTENYGAAPGIDVQITAGTPSDSAFTIKITPAAGAAYYAFVIDQNDEAEQLDSATLYKGGYGNTVLKVADQPSVTIPVTTAAPNTTYQVYAVAGSDKGIVGSIVVKSIKTTDGRRPVPGRFAQGSEQKAIQVAFSEAIARGAGAVTGKYYKEWDWENPVDVAADEIDVQIQDNIIQLTAPTTPDGAYVTFSWAEGAFVDSKGNKCAAFTTTYNEEADDFDGYWVQNKQVAFEIADSYVTAPANGALIGKVEDFKGEITFPFNIYRNDYAVEAGDLTVTYTGANRKATYKLAADNWSVKDKVLNFVLPATPEGGDIITVSLVEGAIADVYGNPNAAFTSTTSWKFFAPTKDMILGTFDFGYYSAYDEEPALYNGGPVTISENPEKEGGLIIKGLFSDLVEGSELEGSYDLSSGKLFIDAYQILGNYTNSKGTTYGLVLYSLTYADLIEFTINADGTIISTDLGIVAYDETYENALGWFEKATIAALSPKTNAAARSMKTWKQAGSKAKKLAARTRSLKKHVSK